MADSDVEEYVKQNSVTTYRERSSNYLKSGTINALRIDTIGTASMLPRSAGGVVDPELLVYGTENIRVVDLSIIPLEVASHLQCECAFRFLM